MRDAIVEVKNLTKVFIKEYKNPFRPKRKITAVNDISFKIKKGEIVGLLGPNGAGKTTTIQILLGLITPTAGEIFILGKNFSLQRKEILKELNFSSTYTHLPWRLTVWENLYAVALMYGIKNAKERVSEVIKLMKLETKRNSEISDLSSGWTTRTNIARIFLNRPKFILLDEPTASLDPEAAEEIREEILKFRKKEGTTILWTSHNMPEVADVCDRVIFLDHGKIIAEDTPEGLARRIKKCRVSLVVKDGRKRLHKISRENNWQLSVKEPTSLIELNEDEIPKLLFQLSQKGISYEQISIDKPTLEDFFLSRRKG